MLETYQQTAWSLAELFPSHDSPEMETAYSRLEAQTAAFEAHRAQLSPDMPVEVFLACLQDMESLSRLVNRVYSYAYLVFASDTQSQAAQAFVAKAEGFLTGLQNRILFFELWWKDLDDAAAQRLLEPTADFHYWLVKIRQFKPHTLSEPEEKIVNIKNVTGASALGLLYNSITNRYTYKITVDGQEQELTRDTLMVYARHSDPALRAAAYQELYRVYGQDGAILGQIYQTLVRDWRNEQVDLRHFSTPISARNLSNDIPDEVVSTLLAVAERNTHVFQRFFRLKARWLGLQRLQRYDIYAPVGKNSEKRYEFNAAAGMVLDAFRQFEPRVATLAQRVFDQTHLDSEVRKGKQSGAFCATVDPDLTPWVLVNYQGRPGDVATLAHELGHAIHSLFAAHHTNLTQQPSLPLAETASIFGEILLIDRLLSTESDENVRRDLLFRQVDDAYGSIQRQSFFAMFERQAHALINAGATVDELSTAYMENLSLQFGDAVEIPAEFRWEWVSIPHIYSVPFYVYAYAFGHLLVLSLFQQYKIEGEAFKPRYLKILSAGGAEAPMSVLSDAGIDVYNPAFWQGGFDVIDRMVDQLEALPVIVD
jgi:oligoendopeptidase F